MRDIMQTRRILVVLVILGSLISPSLAAPQWIARGKSEIVATDSEFASEAGLQILEAGGNAIDAAVAVSFALAVTRPYSTGLGGGGFMIARFADGQIVVQDFRETAPAASTPDMFVKARAKNPDGPPPSQFGFLAVGVPGLVAGRCEALRQWGTMPLARVIQPAIELARDGFRVDDDYVRASREALEVYEKHPSLKDDYPYTYVFMLHLRKGILRQSGDELIQPELTRLLEGLASDGPDFFYRGPVSEQMISYMEGNGGIMTARDLATYQVSTPEPLTTTYRDYKLIMMPLPSSGGIAIAESLNILEALDFAAITKKDRPLAVHFQIEALKHAFADRGRLPGINPERLTSKSHAKQIAGRISRDTSASLDSYGISLLKDSGTSHFCVIDRHGNAVVSTETINTTFGSLAAVGELGLILNNEMDDFTAEPGKPNSFGLIQSAENAPKPGAAPLSSMSPTIVLNDDKVFMLLGASGGSRIISSVLNVILQMLDSGATLEEAMMALRPHHQIHPDEVAFDKPPEKELADALTKRGHKISDKRKTAIVQVILRDGDTWIGASDPRKGGKPAGR